jgi:hypothetical protein
MSYIQTGLLGASPFLTAWLALTLVHQARQSAAFASHRGMDGQSAELSSLIVNRM